MTILSDRSISQCILSRELRIEPYNPSQLQPASYDCLLGPTILYPLNRTPSTTKVDQPGVAGAHIDPYKDTFEPHFGQYDLDPDSETGGMFLYPHQFVLAHTLEHFTLPKFMAARIEGKSTLGRWGLMVHVTAGFIDPGFKGQITLELHNLGPFAIYLQAHKPITQVSFHWLSSEVDKGYAGKYQGQEGVVGGLVGQGGKA